MLEALDRGNLFLVPLDDRRRWYRYHHLFADVLRARLLDEQPDLVPELHRRASDWYEQHGDRAVAIDHALAAEDFARAADLIELAAPATQRDRQEATLRRWLDALPDAQLRVRPVLSNDLAGARLVRGELEGVEPRLQDAERWLDAVAQASGQHLRQRRPRWWWWTRRGSVRSRRRSRSTGPGRRCCSATGRAASHMPGGRWTSPAPTTTSSGRLPRHSSASRRGATGTSMRPTPATRTPG